MNTLWRFETSLLPVAGIVVELLTKRSCHCLYCLPDVRKRIRREIVQRKMCEWKRRCGERCGLAVLRQRKKEASGKSCDRQSMLE